MLILITGKIEAHHTATHLMHWVWYQSVVRWAQQGSLVDYDRLRFDFNSEVRKEQILDLEGIVNEKINENDSVS